MCDELAALGGADFQSPHAGAVQPGVPGASDSDLFNRVYPIGPKLEV